MQCSAKSKQSQQQCKRAAVPGRGVCSIHGGKSLSGIASPLYRDGRYSKVLPAGMRAAYEAARDDPQLLEQREQIAVLDARLIDLMGRVDTGESGGLWQALKDRRTDFIEAQRGKDNVGQIVAMSAILTLIDQGHTDYRAWGELASVLEQRKRIIESERKRLVEMQQMVTSQQAMGLISALLESVKRNVTDRAALTAIQAEFIRITTIHADALTRDLPRKFVINNFPGAPVWHLPWSHFSTFCIKFGNAQTLPQQDRAQRVLEAAFGKTAEARTDAHRFHNVGFVG